jgi:hypothetical protein
LNETEVTIPEIGLDAGFAKIKLAFERNPSFRADVRRAFGPQTDDLLTEVNKIIGSVRDAAMQKGYPGGLVVVLDNLDRVVQTPAGEQKDNHRALFVDQGPFLAGLECHMVYTFPLALNYSTHGPHLPVLYDTDEVRLMPMIPVAERDGGACHAGLAVLREILLQREHSVGAVESGVFSADGGIEELCAFSGGFVVQLLTLFRSTLRKQPTLPVTRASIERAAVDLRNTYQRALTEEQRQALSSLDPGSPAVAQQHPALLFNHTLMEYRDADGAWWDANPLIRELLPRGRGGS